jgi:TonB family protein
MLQAILSALILLASPTDEPITVTYIESIAYPAVARDAQVQGVVEIDAIISPDGVVLSASANSGHPALKHAAEENIRRWKFAPASAKRTLSIIYEFSLQEPRLPYGSETKNYFDLPSKVRVVTNLRTKTD